MRQDAVPLSAAVTASANRPPLRISPRTAAPLTPKSAAITQTHQSSMQRNGLELSNGWAEPPLRVPQPSFLDHNLERGGVLEQMVALGTYPTAKVKARSKKDPVRKVVQARNLEDMVVDDRRVTPELSTHSAADMHERRSLGPFDREALDGGSLIDPEIQGIDTRIRSPATAASSNALPGPSLRSRSSRRSNSGAAPAIPLDELIVTGITKAIRLAVRNGDKNVEQNLLRIHLAGMHDPEFATLLKFAMTNDSLEERGSAINRKLKELKKTLRGSRGLGDTLSKSASAGMFKGSLSLSDAQSQTYDLAGVTIAQMSHEDDEEQANVSGPPSPSPQRLSSSHMTSPLKSLYAPNGTARRQPPISPKKERGMDGKVSRRSSTSSLSSVDEDLAAGPPPLEDDL